jgi:L-ascorbate metabolism protein UlaG (beta-lactamase superfamily)
VISSFGFRHSLVIRHLSFVIFSWHFLAFAQLACGGLEKYPQFVVADKEANALVPATAIRVTYLGVNGFQFENGNHSLLIDPYFSRVGFWSGALNRRIESNPDRVDAGLKHSRGHVEAILVTHAHFDHLLDAPAIMRRTHARLLASPTAVNLVESFGISPSECDVVGSGTVRTIGPWRIRVLSAEHDRLFGKVPFECAIHTRTGAPSPPSSPSGRGGRGAPGEGKMLLQRPVKASDWCVGEPLGFVIEAAGKRIYLDSGGIPGHPPDTAIGHVDLAILGAALPDSRQRFAEVVRQLQPRYILPSHQDDFFGPVDRGFVFGKLTNFPALVQIYQREHLPGRLILLDYFRPWTLP